MSDLFAGPGEVCALARALDWAATPLGPPEHWPPALRTAVRLMFDSPVATGLWCGPAYTLLYNDAYRRILNAKHPAALGRSGADVWAELWAELEPQFAQVRAGGAAVHVPDARFLMARLEGGGVEESYFDYAISALRDEAGAVLAVYNVAVEQTAVVHARREVEGLLAERQEAYQALQVANAQLQDQQVELELGNQQLQEQAAELEAANEELRETTDALTRQTEAAEAARARADDILESMADAYFALDASFRITAVNAAMERGSGLARDQLLGRSFWALFPGTLGTAFERHYRRAVGERVAGHFTHDYSDGRLDLVVEVDAYPAAGGGMAAFWRDVTTRARAEAAVRASEAKYRSLFESIDQGFCIIDVLFDDAGRPADYRFVETNPTFEAQTGLVGAGGRTARELVPGLEQHWFDTYGRVAVTGEPARFENGSEAMGRWFDLYAFRVGAPEARRVAVLFSDVSAAKAAARERERLLAESEAARAAAESANRAKGEFLAVMSHELRTPLNAIGGYAELLAMGIRGPLTAAQREDLARIQTSQRHLLGLINEVLNYARVESGAVRYDATDVDLADVVASVEPLVAPQLGAKRLAYGHDGCGAAPAVARADREKVRQVLLNLLSNAIKFTEPGGRIEVACDAAPAGGRVRLRVRDTGAGIALDQQERVFEPFVQVDARLTRTHEGTGLGLAISRDLARGMGGDLTIESAPGAGSTFTLTLPAGGAAAAPASAPNATA